MVMMTDSSSADSSTERESAIKMTDSEIAQVEWQLNQPEQRVDSADAPLDTPDDISSSPASEPEPKRCKAEEEHQVEYQQSATVSFLVDGRSIPITISTGEARDESPCLLVGLLPDVPTHPPLGPPTGEFAGPSHGNDTHPATPSADVLPIVPPHAPPDESDAAFGADPNGGANEPANHPLNLAISVDSLYRGAYNENPLQFPVGIYIRDDPDPLKCRLVTMGFNALGRPIRNVLKHNITGQVVPMNGTTRKRFRGSSMRPVEISYFAEVPAAQGAEAVKSWVFDQLESQGITEQLNWRNYEVMCTEPYRRILSRDRINRLANCGFLVPLFTGDEADKKADNFLRSIQRLNDEFIAAVKKTQCDNDAVNEHNPFKFQELYAEMVFLKDKLDAVLDGELFQWSCANIAHERDQVLADALEGKESADILSSTLTDKDFHG
ncbi:hypothetical protein BDV27DRAFT_28304 [Aspergillus caelatus]|uniref:Uncharacterized protein n=2 Tax=Aspergillus subgen. Circumdati TaxID=2720871 RepID=A0A5N6ZWZ8_9EURO|nr:uncharacterized protein BDV27DRAFT_28304 [Aspergillus caelatus]KAE8361449.1 hypothetical protein BDV27DRAFT_28304 [Aspergillus caelatus]